MKFQKFTFFSQIEGPVQIQCKTREIGAISARTRRAFGEAPGEGYRKPTDVDRLGGPRQSGVELSRQGWTGPRERVRERRGRKQNHRMTNHG